MLSNTVIDACRIAAAKYGVPVSTIAAVVETESAGIIFARITLDGEITDEPVIRWEGHYFYRLVAASLKDKAVSLGLASPRVGGVPNPSKQQDRWGKLLVPAMKLDYDAAVQSISIGVGQVMGSHWKTLDFTSPRDMFVHARTLVGQIDLMMRYCDKFGLLDELRRADFTGFARGYNGPAYKTNRYDEKMRDAAKRYANLDSATKIDGVSVGQPIRSDNAATMLRMGTEGAGVREVQELLRRAGYAIEVDGDFGPATKTTVEAFQKDNGLEIDGIVGPKTWEALNAFKTDPQEAPGVPGPAEAVVQTPEGRQGAVCAGVATLATTAINPAKEALLPLLGTSPFIDTTFTWLTVGGVVLALGGAAWSAYGYFRANRTRGVKV